MNKYKDSTKGYFENFLYKPTYQKYNSSDDLENCEQQQLEEFTESDEELIVPVKPVKNEENNNLVQTIKKICQKIVEGTINKLNSNNKCNDSNFNSRNNIRNLV